MGSNDVRAMSTRCTALRPWLLSSTRCDLPEANVTACVTSGTERCHANEDVLRRPLSRRGVRPSEDVNIRTDSPSSRDDYSPELTNANSYFHKTNSLRPTTKSDLNLPNEFRHLYSINTSTFCHHAFHQGFDSGLCRRRRRRFERFVGIS